MSPDIHRFVGTTEGTTLSTESHKIPLKCLPERQLGSVSTIQVVIVLEPPQWSIQILLVHIHSMGKWLRHILIHFLHSYTHYVTVQIVWLISVMNGFPRDEERERCSCHQRRNERRYGLDRENGTMLVAWMISVTTSSHHGENNHRNWLETRREERIWLFEGIVRLSTLVSTMQLFTLLE